MARRRKRRSSQKRKGLFLAMCTVFILCGMVAIKKVELDKEQKAYAREKATLEAQIDDLEKEYEEIEDQKEYAKTKQFVEEVAREKLNLIYPGEVVFEPEN